MVKTSHIIEFLEHSLADISKQSSWDFSGNQVFTGDKAVSKVALSLDPAKEIIEKAIKEGCELLITHHPLFFRKIKGLDISSKDAEKAVIAVRGGLDILSYHTNLDIALGGLNDYICELLGFPAEASPLSCEGSLPLYKLSIFVPYDYKDTVFNAVTSAGAGSIGNYSACGFMSEGVGLFTPNEHAVPFIGSHNEKVIADEVKIETVVYQKDLKRVVKAMMDAHPYEEPAFDIIRLEKGADYGFGRICRSSAPLTLENFIEMIKLKLGVSDIKTNMRHIQPFAEFAVCTGSGASLWREALNKNIRVLLTGDLKYHDALEAKESGVCIIDAGHQGTEEIYMDRLGEILKNKFNIEIKIYKQDLQILHWGNY
ncbi:MAG: Nif3-like dinuclear metal center hexameric protein [Mucispirillum sp.]|nr:Nif3-like dinuclear metal center hexameric protein [Mucispirillum sp.]